ncbi:PAS domain-containing protein [Haloarchaeobius litoreus]|uniref:histidine kinase n=1 Tax=Haloarchaeobius litoreus TaxID=755306 RepID=A0ABD6DMR2_9EURY|nr:PAS domain-containing protein [Haloarchaeobius litoreus]
MNSPSFAARVPSWTPKPDVDDESSVLVVAADGDGDVSTLARTDGLDVVRVDGLDAVSTALADGAVDCVVHADGSDVPAVTETLQVVRDVSATPYVLYAREPDVATVDEVLMQSGTAYVPRRGRDAAARLLSQIRRLTSERSLRQALELRERALDQATVGITVADADESLVFVNEGFAELTGYDADEVVGVNCRFLQGEGTDEGTVAEIRAALDAGEPISTVVRNYRKDGTPFWNQLDITPVDDGSGTVTHYFGFQQDVTERVELQERLRDRNERLDEFAEVVSHDLRGPLSVAQGYLDGLEDERVDAAADALDRMERLIEDVLTLAREGRSRAETEPVSLEAVATRAWTTAETGDLDVELGDGLGTVEADPERLQTLFENLFRNVVDHAPGATTVRVEATDAGFAVVDDGQGIDPTVADSLFEQGITTDDDGTGFGLAIVSTVAEAHGWSVAACSGENGGARFEVDCTGGA